MRSVLVVWLVLLASPATSGCDSTSRVGSRIASLGSTELTIAVVYPGGGNTGATFDRDYVVLVNRAPSPVSTSGLSLQYASGSGASAIGATDATRTELPDRVLAPGQALLVPAAFGASAAPALPVGDVDDATPIALSGASGRLVVVRGTSALGCNGGSIPCDAAALARVVDLVAWGSASWAETTPALAPSNAEAIVRRGDGCVDTDANALDLERAAPIVRRSGDPFRPCDGTGAGDGGTIDAGAVDAATAVDAGTSPDSGTSVEGMSPVEVQGDHFRSPLDGVAIADLRGVVTYVEARRFAIEAEAPVDAASGVFVRTVGAPPVVVGAYVAVDGIVREVRPSCASCPGGESPTYAVTTVEASRVVQLGRRPLPEPVDLDLALPERFTARDTRIDLESHPIRMPQGDALERLERLEARRVRFAAPIVVGPTRTRSDGRRTLAIVSDRSAPLLNAHGLVPDPAYGVFGGVFVVVDSASFALPLLDVGDRFEGPLVGIVDTDAGRPVVRVLGWADARHVERPPTRLEPAAPEALSIATFNVHGLAATDSFLAFTGVARVVVDELLAPDLVVLEEIADDSGIRDDGTVSAAETLARLVDAIAVAGGPRYRSIAIDPRDGEDGGAPGANIRSALLVREDRGFTIEPRGGEPDLPTIGRGPDEAVFSPNPMRLGADSDAYEDGRKPLVVALDRDGESLVVVCVHLRSHLGDEPRFGRMQPPNRPSDSSRRDQMIVVAEFLDALRRRRADQALVVVGDFNDPAESAAIAPLVERGILPARPDAPDDVATYVYDGLATSFDRVHLSPTLAERVITSRPVHVAATRAQSVSDHDPVRVVLAPRSGATAPGGCSLGGGSRRSGVDLRCATSLVAILFGLRRLRRCP